jgi:hypothetical protein
MNPFLREKGSKKFVSVRRGLTQWDNYISLLNLDVLALLATAFIIVLSAKKTNNTYLFV